MQFVVHDELGDALTKEDSIIIQILRYGLVQLRHQHILTLHLEHEVQQRNQSTLLSHVHLHYLLDVRIAQLIHAVQHIVFTDLHQQSLMDTQQQLLAHPIVTHFQLTLERFTEVVVLQYTDLLSIQ